MDTAKAELESLELGPKMQALTEMQRLFVLNYVSARGNATGAARASGYGKDSPTKEQADEACRQAGHRMIHDPKILGAMKEDAERRLNAGVAMAAEELVSLATASPDEKVRIKAALGVLALGGISPISRVEHIHSHQTTAAMTAEIEKMAKALGLDSRALLGYDPDQVQDAVFEVVGLPAPAEEREPWEDM